MLVLKCECWSASVDVVRLSSWSKIVKLCGLAEIHRQCNWSTVQLTERVLLAGSWHRGKSFRPWCKKFDCDVVFYIPTQTSSELYFYLDFENLIFKFIPWLGGNSTFGHLGYEGEFYDLSFSPSNKSPLAQKGEIVYEIKILCMRNHQQDEGAGVGGANALRPPPDPQGFVTLQNQRVSPLH